MKSFFKIALACFLTLAVLQPAVVWPAAGKATAGLTFTVNNTADLPDAVPGNGICEAIAGAGNCTLRAATMESNANSNPDITINIPAGVYQLTIPAIPADDDGHGSLKLFRSLTVTGAGSDETIIDGNGSVIHDRVIEVTSGSNVTFTIQGLTLQDGQVTNAQPTGARGGGDVGLVRE
jgi:hypothetical protein